MRIYHVKVIEDDILHNIGLVELIYVGFISINKIRKAV